MADKTQLRLLKNYASEYNKVLHYESNRDYYLGNAVNEARALGVTIEDLSAFTGVSKTKLSKLSKSQGFKNNKYHTEEELRAMYLEKRLYCSCIRHRKIHETFEDSNVMVCVKSGDTVFRDKVLKRLEREGYA